MRFRRTIKLLPGMRLDIGAHGLAAADTDVGPHDAYTFLGATAAAPGRGARGTRERSRELRRREIADQRADAHTAHGEHRHRLAVLRAIVRDRNRRPFDWRAEFAPLDPYEPAPFHPPEPVADSDRALAELQRVNPIGPWLAPVVAAAGVAALVNQPIARVVFLLIAAYYCLRAAALLLAQRQAVEPLLAKWRAYDGERFRAAKSEYDAVESRRRAAHDAEQALRQRIREADVNRDPEIAGMMLEAELSHEQLPVPVVLEIAVDDAGLARIEVEMPDLSEVPLTTTTLTSRGESVVRTIPQAHRIAIYADLCAGVAIRLAHEVFRVLPFVRAVRVTGAIFGRNATTGRRWRHAAVAIDTARERMARIDLDRVHPSVPLEFAAPAAPVPIGRVEAVG